MSVEAPDIQVGSMTAAPTGEVLAKTLSGLKSLPDTPATTSATEAGAEAPAADQLAQIMNAKNELDALSDQAAAGGAPVETAIATAPAEAAAGAVPSTAEGIAKRADTRSGAMAELSSMARPPEVRAMEDAERAAQDAAVQLGARNGDQAVPAEMASSTVSEAEPVVSNPVVGSDVAPAQAGQTVLPAKPRRTLWQRLTFRNR